MRTMGEPFNNAEEAWFWFCSCLIVRGDGLRSKSDYCGSERPCEISDIHLIIKKLKRNRLISNRHLRVMVRWGQFQVPPYYDKHAKRSEIRLWEEGIKALDAYLRQLNLIAL